MIPSGQLYVSPRSFWYATPSKINSPFHNQKNILRNCTESESTLSRPKNCTVMPVKSRWHFVEVMRNESITSLRLQKWIQRIDKRFWNSYSFLFLQRSPRPIKMHGTCCKLHFTSIIISKVIECTGFFKQVINSALLDNKLLLGETCFSHN